MSTDFANFWQKYTSLNLKQIGLHMHSVAHPTAASFICSRRTV